MLEPEQISEHGAVLEWVPPARLGGEVVHYELEYGVSGTQDMHTIVVGEPWCEVTGLAMDTLYTASARVVTTSGSSEYSSTIPLTTLFTQTEMGQFKDEVYGAISEIVEDVRRETRICAVNAGSTDTGTLKYDSVYSEIIHGGGGVLDVGTGLFTAGWAGVYQVAYNMELISESDQEHQVWVVVNGAQVAQSMIHSACHSNDHGPNIDIGGRVIMVSLHKGDTVALTHQTNGSGGLNRINFCVSSVMLQ